MEYQYQYLVLVLVSSNGAFYMNISTCKNACTCIPVPGLVCARYYVIAQNFAGAFMQRSGSIGQLFTTFPANFTKTVKELVEEDCRVFVKGRDDTETLGRAVQKLKINLHLPIEGVLTTVYL